jgi:hypothetical protein
MDSADDEQAEIILILSGVTAGNAVEGLFAGIIELSKTLSFDYAANNRAAPLRTKR